jgi:hypothetical protein
MLKGTDVDWEVEADHTVSIAILLIVPGGDGGAMYTRLFQLGEVSLTVHVAWQGAEMLCLRSFVHRQLAAEVEEGFDVLESTRWPSKNRMASLA